MDHPPRPTPHPRAAQLLRAALSAYGLSLRQLRQLASQPGADLRAALGDPSPPPALLALLDLQAAMLTPTRREPVRSPADVAALLMLRLDHLDQEQLVTVCLDARRCVQEVALIYRGTVSQALVRVAEVFRPAVRLNSSAIILAHNHPSGAPEPSAADIELTGCCAQAGRALDIALVDHLIVGAGRWASVHAWSAQRGGA
jgi:DNA repair protein RadC